MYISYFRTQKDKDENYNTNVVAGFLILLGFVFLLFSAIIALVMYHNGLIISSLTGFFFLVIGVAVSKHKGKENDR